MRRKWYASLHIVSTAQVLNREGINTSSQIDACTPQQIVRLNREHDNMRLRRRLYGLCLFYVLQSVLIRWLWLQASAHPHSRNYIFYLFMSLVMAFLSLFLIVPVLEG
jgi:hypothetical protein